MTANLSADDDVGMVTVGNPDARKPLIQGVADEFQPAVSPDGRWLASTSNETGRDELIYLQTSWGPPEAVMVPLDIQNGPSPTLRPGKPERLFDYRYYSSQGGRREFPDVSPDGCHFLMIANAGGGFVPSRIMIVQNWFEELKRLVPAGN